MGKQIMLVNVHEDETRIALVEEQVLVGLHVQQTDRERKVGNIYRGKVVKVNPAFQAAFIDYGEPRNGFLSISDVNFHLHRPKEGDKGRPKIQNVLREGQPVMVQILKEGMSNKGSALTTFVSLAGRYMVMSPNSDRSGVSRKIEDPDTRRRLKDIMEALAGGDDLGVIIRTAGIDQPVTELKRDLESLRKEWKGIQSRYDKEKKPALLYQEPSPIVRVLRDYFSADVQEVWVDDPEGFQEALGYFKSTLPKFQKRLKLYVGDKSLFSAHRIEEQIESLDSAKVPLRSGGSVIIEATEALVSIDVNSGRSNQAQDIEDTALRTNLEAAAEVARQLRLRNLGGLIVIDFIDMMQAKNRKTVEKAIADGLKDDKARTTIGTISQFGLLELSRQRIDMELSRGLRISCPNCAGTGRIPTVNSSANTVLRKIRELAATGRYTEIHGSMPLESANFLLNEKREALRDLELEFEIGLKLEADPDLPSGHPITLHGARSDGGAEDRAMDTPRRDEVIASDMEPAGEDGGTRRRRRRRRRRGGERGDSHEVDLRRDDPEVTESDHAAWADTDLMEEELPVEDLAADSNGAGEVADEPAERPAGRGRGRGRDRGRSGRDAPADERPLPPRTNGSGGGVIYQSEHIITNPEALEKMPPRIVRSSPFGGVVDAVEPDTVVFDSANLGTTGGLAIPAVSAAQTKPKPSKAAEVKAAEAKALESKGNGVDKDEVDGQEEEVKAAPKRQRTRRGRGRRGASDAGKKPEASAASDAPEAEADVDAETAAPAPAVSSDPDIYDPAYGVDEETGLPDNFGNLIDPPRTAKSAAKPTANRPRRPRRRPGGKPGAPAARPARGPAAGGDRPNGNAEGGAGKRRPRSRRGRGGRRPNAASGTSA